MYVHVRATCRAPERSLAPLTRGKSAAGISAASSAETTISTEGRSFISRAEIRPLVPALDAAAQQGQRGAYAYSAPPAPAPTRSMRAMPSGAQAAAEFDDEVAERAHAAARKVAPPVRRRAILQPSRCHLPAIPPLTSHRLAGDRSCQEGGCASTHRGSGGAPPRPPRHSGAGAGLLGWRLHGLAARLHLCRLLCGGVAAAVAQAPRLTLDGQKPRRPIPAQSRRQSRAASRSHPTSHRSQWRRSRGEAKAGAVRCPAICTIRDKALLGKQPQVRISLARECISRPRDCVASSPPVRCPPPPALLTTAPISARP